MVTCVNFLKVGGWGTKLIFEVIDCVNGVNIPLDITDASELNIRIKKTDTDKTIFDVVGSIYTGGDNGDGTDGLVVYTVPEEISINGGALQDFVAEGDSGKWIVEVTPVFATGEYPSTTGKITVKERLQLA